jgi:hypothetical protein
MTQAVQMEDAEDEAFLRRLVLPEEDRRRLYPATRPWTGGYRWFRSENVIPIEQARRRLREQTPVSPAPAPTPAPKPAA